MFVRACCLSIWLVIASGCDEEGIRAYRAPKDPPASVGRPVAAEAASGAIQPSMDWAVPHGWRQLPGQRPMRVATFEAASGERPVEITVSAFPDRAGGLLANVNRWRAQISLNPIGQQDLADALVAFSNQHVRGFSLDFTESAATVGDGSPQRIVGAIIEDGGPMTWFVKAKDDAATLEPLKAQIDQFARSFQPRADSSPPNLPRPEPAVAQPAGRGGWSPPDHWKPDGSASAMLAAAYNIHTPEGHARVTVTVLSGDGGGLLPNVNRWRGQLGLPPVDGLVDQPMTAMPPQPGQLPATMIDLLAAVVGPAGRQRILAAVLPDADKTWYVKMTGVDRAAEQEKPAFEALVRSIRTPRTLP